MSSAARFAKGKKRTFSKMKSAVGRRKFLRGTPIAQAMVQAQRRRTSQAIKNAVTMGFLGIERKFYDTSLAPTNVGADAGCASGEFDPSATSMISTPAVGDSEQNREGKKINILSAEIHGTLRVAGNEATLDPAAGLQVFVALVLDTQSNAAQMNSEDCFKNQSADSTLLVTPMRNLLFAQRFRVIKSKTFLMTPNTLAVTAANAHDFNGVVKTFKWFVKFPKGLPVNFNAGTTASIANVTDNSLHIIAFANNTAQVPTLGYNARIRFVG